MTTQSHEPTKSDFDVHPVPTRWRPVLKDVVKALAEGDYALSREIPCVRMKPSAPAQIRSYVADYGERLVELPDDTWQSSFALWTGTHCTVTVSLWTAESGESDMVLSARVFEDSGDYRFEIGLVYVP